MKQSILSVYILLYLVESSSRSPANPLENILGLGIWKSEKNTEKGETSQYKVVVKGVDAYKVVWWPKDFPADRRIGIANLKLDSEGSMLMEWEDQYGQKKSWICNGAFELLTGQHDLDWKYFETERVGNVAETWTSCFEDVSALPDPLKNKLAKQEILEVLRKIEQHNQKVKSKKQGISLRPRKPLPPAPRSQATTVSGPMPQPVVGDEKQSVYVTKEEDFPSLGEATVKASNSKKAHVVQKSSRLLSQAPTFDADEEIPSSMSFEQLTQPESSVATPRTADVPPPPPHSPLPPLLTSPCPPSPHKPKRIESKCWYLNEEEIKQQGWETFQSDEGQFWFFNEEENAWFWKLHQVDPVADPESQQYEEVNLSDGKKMWWNPNTEGFFYAMGET